MPDDYFQELLDFWNLPAIQQVSETNKANRKCHDDTHTLGPKSLAMLRHELQQEDPNKQPPSLAKVYTESRRRLDGRTYKTSYDKIKGNMDKMGELEAAHEHGESANSKDPYYEVINKPESKGRLRLYGRGVTQSTLKKKANTTTSYILPKEFLEGIEVNLVSKIVPNMAKIILSQLKDANPALNFVVPNFQFDKSGEGVAGNELNVQSSVGNNASSQEVNEETNNEDHELELEVNPQIKDA